MAKLEEVVEAALKINLHGRDYTTIFRLDTWQNGQLLPTREQINGISRQVMLKIATDKEETRKCCQVSNTEGKQFQTKQAIA